MTNRPDHPTFAILNSLTEAERAIALAYMAGNTTGEVLRQRDVSQGTLSAQHAAMQTKLNLPDKMPLRTFFFGYAMGYKESEEKKSDESTISHS